MPVRGVERAHRLLPWMRTIRRELHRTPELAYHEVETQRAIADRLRELGLRPVLLPHSTALLATIPSEGHGPPVALRAEMDGLPVMERTGLSYRSRIPGQMHACGHDLHMAGLLGAARLLIEEGPPRGPVRLLFQPAEEEGCRGGAAELIARGALRGPKVTFVLGQHVEPTLPVGTVALRPGPMMAAADQFDITVRGTGGHAGYPHAGPDAILVAAEIINGLQALVSRTKNPVDPAVISVGAVHGGDRRNVLPSEVTISGTVRTLSAPLREQLERSLPARARGLAASLGASVRVKYVRGYPALVNDPETTARVGAAFAAALGPEQVTYLAEPVLGAEDFARYLEQLPGTFWFLGTGPIGSTGAPKHSGGFAPDEAALSVAAAALVIGTRELQGGSAA
ncbi:MAG: M20 metallopeptidase family protein [Thermoplasmata archaeon]